MRTLRLFLLFTFALLAQKPTQAARDVICEVLDNTSAPDSRFQVEIGFGYALEALSDASDFVLESFNQTHGGGRGYSTVLVIIESFLAKGYPPTIASNDGNQFRVDADYLQTFIGDVKEEFTGIIYHESGRVWQWTGSETAPIGLITGIADYIRLTAGWPSKNWLSRRSGLRWDEGYAVTAYFLEFCSGKRPGFVSDPNAMMESSYSDAFFAILLGQPVDELWEEYVKFMSQHETVFPAPALRSDTNPGLFPLQNSRKYAVTAYPSSHLKPDPLDSQFFDGHPAVNWI